MTSARIAFFILLTAAATLRAQELGDPYLAPTETFVQDAYPQGASEFSLGIGYANVSIGSNTAIDGEGGIRFEPSFTCSPIQKIPQLRLGFDVAVTLILDNSNRTIISDGGITYYGSSDIPLWFLEPELRLSWRQPFGKQNQFFIEPGIAGGAAFGFLEIDSVNGFDSYDESDSTLFGRVFLRAGAQVTGGLAGIEASWGSGGNMNFGENASGDFEEFYIGIFGSLLF